MTDRNETPNQRDCPNGAGCEHHPGGHDRRAGETVTLELVLRGHERIEVDRREYLEAKRTGRLDHMLDAYASDLDGDLFIVEPAEMGGQTLRYDTGEPID
ncbi:hypothetical protein [Micromonospora chalcea]|uniref:hypothetical protein n=1 Tax=Micromonospora chalcea TaxID=1874 RepID=UPI003D751831